MNRDLVLFHLREALQELERTTREIEGRADYGEIELTIAMQHLYNHLNTAWNARDRAPQEAADLTKEDFYRLRQFPNDLDMSAP
jgi:hypothetical protein